MSNFTGSSEHSGIPTKKISGDNSSTAGSRSRYAALRDRRAKVARSKSTAVVGFMGYNNDEGNLLTANIFESGPMPTPWKFLDSLAVIPSC